MNKKAEMVKKEDINKLSVYREKLVERKELVQKTLDDMPQQEWFDKDTVLSKFLDFYFTNEKRRLSDTLTSTMPLKKDTIELLQEKQLAIRHLKLFIENLGNNTEELKEEITNINTTLDQIDKGEFDESIIENLDLGV